MEEKIRTKIKILLFLHALQTTKDHFWVSRIHFLILTPNGHGIHILDDE
jgi:hypothetical protein